jgi:uncharacterized protein YcgI (DUF1989 family)
MWVRTVVTDTDSSRAISGAGKLVGEPARSRPGDLVRLRAGTDLIVIMSACPQDLLPVNGLEQQPTNVHFRVHAADRA